MEKEFHLSAAQTALMNVTQLGEEIVRQFDRGYVSVVVDDTALADAGRVSGDGPDADYDGETAKLAHRLAQGANLATGTEDGGDTWWFRRPFSAKKVKAT